MRNVFKRISIVLVALMLVSTIYVLSDSKVAFAAPVQYTVTFHYTRADGNISGYTINTWAPDNEGAEHEFTVNGSEGVFVYTFLIDDETYDPEDVKVHFIIHEAGTKNESFEDTKIDMTSTTQDVYIASNGGDNQDWGYQPISLDSLGGTDATQTETTASSQQAETTAAVQETETTSSSAQTETVAAGTDNTGTDVGGTTTTTSSPSSKEDEESSKDFSVGFFQALIIDIIVFAILGGLSFLSLSKEKKTAIEKKKSI